MAEAGRTATFVATLKEAHECFNHRDFETLRQKIAEDVTYRDHGGNRVFRGLDEWIKEWIQAWAEGFSDGRIEEGTYIDGGDTVTALITGRGTNDGSFGPFPATGRRVEFRACEVVHFNDEGKMVSGEVFYDRMTILGQLGHIEAPAGA